MMDRVLFARTIRESNANTRETFADRKPRWRFSVEESDQQAVNYFFFRRLRRSRRFLEPIFRRRLGLGIVSRTSFVISLPPAVPGKGRVSYRFGAEIERGKEKKQKGGVARFFWPWRRERGHPGHLLATLSVYSCVVLAGCVTIAG